MKNICVNGSSAKSVPGSEKNASVHSSDGVLSRCIVVLRVVSMRLQMYTHDVFLRGSRALATDFLPAVCEPSALITT
jgi:hypothetical protein